MARVKADRDLRHRNGCALGVDQLNPVAKLCARHIGEIKVCDGCDVGRCWTRNGRDGGCRCRDLRSAFGLFISRAFTGFDRERIDGAGQPAAHNGLDLRRRHRCGGHHLFFVKIAVAPVKRAFGQSDGFAGETADLFQPGNPP